jgi:hypothetical protein
MVRWKTVASGSSCAETQQKLQLASDQRELDTVWQRVLLQNRSQPIVDFSKDRCLIIFLGSRNTGGYSAQVTQVATGPGTSTSVFVNELFPGPRQVVTQSLTSPWVMIAVDRVYANFKASIQKIEDNSLPSFQIGPMTTFTPLPWSPCGYGYGGSWNDPCGYGFDSPGEFQSWCNQNNFDSPYQTGQIDFNQNRLVFVSAGDYGMGYSLQIGDIFIQGAETIVQVSRNGQSSSDKRSYLLLALGRNTKKYNVEYLVSSNECFVERGQFLPIQRSGAWVFQSQKDWNKTLFDNGVATPASISQFEYSKGNMGVVYLGQMSPTTAVSVTKVAYRGQTAVVYMKKSTSSIPSNSSFPYFVFKLDKKVKNIKIVDL